jgi:poly-beta-1,6-N-acetyl-D-glucosamine biosynthesis protein PgaD
MNEFIINSPKLQSLQKRISGMIVWGVCWLMWIYLLIPLITLSSWLMGDNTLANQMRWFGGYKSLLELLEIYFVTLLALALLWIVWVSCHAFRKQSKRANIKAIVTDHELCSYYQVNWDELETCREAQLTTVFFDDHGKIVKIEPVLI